MMYGQSSRQLPLGLWAPPSLPAEDNDPFADMMPPGDQASPHQYGHDQFDAGQQPFAAPPGTGYMLATAAAAGYSPHAPGNGTAEASNSVTLALSHGHRPVVNRQNSGDLRLPGRAHGLSTGNATHQHSPQRSTADSGSGRQLSLPPASQQASVVTRDPGRSHRPMSSRSRLSRSSSDDQTGVTSDATLPSAPRLQSATRQQGTFPRTSRRSQSSGDERHRHDAARGSMDATANRRIASSPSAGLQRQSKVFALQPTNVSTNSLITLDEDRGSVDIRSMSHQHPPSGDEAPVKTDSTQLDGTIANSIAVEKLVVAPALQALTDARRSSFVVLYGSSQSKCMSLPLAPTDGSAELQRQTSSERHHSVLLYAGNYLLDWLENLCQLHGGSAQDLTLQVSCIQLSGRHEAHDMLDPRSPKMSTPPSSTATDDKDVTSRGGVRACWHVVDSRKRLLQYHQRAKLMRHTSSLLARGHRKHPALHTRHAVYSLRIASNEAPVFDDFYRSTQPCVHFVDVTARSIPAANLYSCGVALPVENEYPPDVVQTHSLCHAVNAVLQKRPKISFCFSLLTSLMKPGIQGQADLYTLLSLEHTMEDTVKVLEFGRHLRALRFQPVVTDDSVVSAAEPVSHSKSIRAPSARLEQKPKRLARLELSSGGSNSSTKLRNGGLAPMQRPLSAQWRESFGDSYRDTATCRDGLGATTNNHVNAISALSPSSQSPPVPTSIAIPSPGLDHMFGSPDGQAITEKPSSWPASKEIRPLSAKLVSTASRLQQQQTMSRLIPPRDRKELFQILSRPKSSLSIRRPGTESLTRADEQSGQAGNIMVGDESTVTGEKERPGKSDMRSKTLATIEDREIDEQGQPQDEEEEGEGKAIDVEAEAEKVSEGEPEDTKMETKKVTDEEDKSQIQHQGRDNACLSASTPPAPRPVAASVASSQTEISGGSRTLLTDPLVSKMTDSEVASDASSDKSMQSNEPTGNTIAGSGDIKSIHNTDGTEYYTAAASVDNFSPASGEIKDDAPNGAGDHQPPHKRMDEDQAAGPGVAEDSADILASSASDGQEAVQDLEEESREVRDNNVGDNVKENESMEDSCNDTPIKASVQTEAGGGPGDHHQGDKDKPQSNLELPTRPSIQALHRSPTAMPTVPRRDYSNIAMPTRRKSLPAITSKRPALLLGPHKRVLSAKPALADGRITTTSQPYAQGETAVQAKQPLLSLTGRRASGRHRKSSLTSSGSRTSVATADDVSLAEKTGSNDGERLTDTTVSPPQFPDNEHMLEDTAASKQVSLAQADGNVSGDAEGANLDSITIPPLAAASVCDQDSVLASSLPLPESDIETSSLLNFPTDTANKEVVTENPAEAERCDSEQEAGDGQSQMDGAGSKEEHHLDEENNLDCTGTQEEEQNEEKSRTEEEDTGEAALSASRDSPSPSRDSPSPSRDSPSPSRDSPSPSRDSPSPSRDSPVPSQASPSPSQVPELAEPMSAVSPEGGSTSLGTEGGDDVRSEVSATTLGSKNISLDERSCCSSQGEGSDQGSLTGSAGENPENNVGAGYSDDDFEATSNPSLSNSDRDEEKLDETGSLNKENTSVDGTRSHDAQDLDNGENHGSGDDGSDGHSIGAAQQDLGAGPSLTSVASGTDIQDHLSEDETARISNEQSANVESASLANDNADEVNKAAQAEITQQPEEPAIPTHSSSDSNINPQQAEGSNSNTLGCSCNQDGEKDEAEVMASSPYEPTTEAERNQSKSEEHTPAEEPTIAEQLDDGTKTHDGVEMDTLSPNVGRLTAASELLLMPGQPVGDMTSPDTTVGGEDTGQEEADHTLLVDSVAEPADQAEIQPPDPEEEVPTESSPEGDAATATISTALDNAQLAQDVKEMQQYPEIEPVAPLEAAVVTSSGADGTAAATKADLSKTKEAQELDETQQDDNACMDMELTLDCPLMTFLSDKKTGVLANGQGGQLFNGAQLLDWLLQNATASHVHSRRAACALAQRIVENALVLVMGEEDDVMEFQESATYGLLPTSLSWNTVDEQQPPTIVTAASDGHQAVAEGEVQEQSNQQALSNNQEPEKGVPPFERSKSTSSVKSKTKSSRPASGSSTQPRRRRMSRKKAEKAAQAYSQRRFSASEDLSDQSLSSASESDVSRAGSRASLRSLRERGNTSASRLHQHGQPQQNELPAVHEDIAPHGPYHYGGAAVDAQGQLVQLQDPLQQQQFFEDGSGYGMASDGRYQISMDAYEQQLQEQQQQSPHNGYLGNQGFDGGAAQDDLYQQQQQLQHQQYQQQQQQQQQEEEAQTVQNQVEDAVAQAPEDSFNSKQPIHVAARADKVRDLRKLLEQFGVDCLDEEQRTPLMYAAMGDNQKSCRVLLSKGADINLMDSWGLAAVHWAACSNKPRALQALLTHGTKNSISLVDSQNRSALHWASKSESVECLEVIIKMTSRDIINHQDSEGLTALHWCVACGHVEHLKQLLHMAADLTLMDNEGKNPLTYAVRNQSVTCINAILEHCPEALRTVDPAGRTALHYAAADGDLSTVMSLIPYPHCDVNAVDNQGLTALHYAVARNFPTVVHALLRRSADFSIPDSAGRTVIDYTALYDHQECAHILTEFQHFAASHSTTNSRQPGTVARHASSGDVIRSSHATAAATNQRRHLAPNSQGRGISPQGSDVHQGVTTGPKRSITYSPSSMPRAEAEQSPPSNPAPMRQQASGRLSRFKSIIKK